MLLRSLKTYFATLHLVIQCWRSQKRPKALGQISLTVALHGWIDTLRSRFWSEFFIL